MYKSILFFLLTFFLSSGFVEYAEPAEKDGDRQRKFLEFLSYFEKVSLPYSLDLQAIECSSNVKSKKRENLAEDQKFFKIAQKFLPLNGGAKFSRMGRPTIRPMARFFPDDATVVVIYSSKMSFRSPLMNDYFMAYYDLKGNLLGQGKKGLNSSSQQIGFTNLHHTQTFTIFPSGKIETVFYDNHWKAKVGSIAMEKNKLLGFKKVKTATYELAGNRGIQRIAYSEVKARP